MSVFNRILCLFAVLSMVEGHLIIGQAIAWGTMIWDRTPSMGLEEAVVDTLSGESPCPICLAVQQQQERQQEKVPHPEASPLAKAVPSLAASARITVYPPRAGHPPRCRSDRRAADWKEEVPVPPPWIA